VHEELTTKGNIEVRLQLKLLKCYASVTSLNCASATAFRRSVRAHCAEGRIILKMLLKKGVVGISGPQVRIAQELLYETSRERSGPVLRLSATLPRTNTGMSMAILQKRRETCNFYLQTQTTQLSLRPANRDRRICDMPLNVDLSAYSGVTLCSLVETCRCFGPVIYLLMVICSTLKMEAVLSYET
jgi:hypothetical protein